VYVAASTRCFAGQSFEEACHLITDLEFDKVEIWMSETSNHLRPSVVAADPEAFVNRYREVTRLSPVAIVLEEDVPLPALAAISRLAKQMRVTQITVSSALLGTPFNTEVDRLKSYVRTCNEDGVRLSIKTRIGRLSEDPHTAVELCQSVKGLGLTLDPSCYVSGPNRGKSYDQVYPYVYHVHLRDSTPEQLQIQVGLGEIDYSRIISQLKREHYARILSVDILPELTPELDRSLELRKLRMLLETLL